MTCKHLHIRTWVFAEGEDRGEAAGMWSCADCGRRFEPTQPEPAVPAGHWLAPDEPTPKMIAEIEDAARMGAIWRAESVYRAMRAAHLSTKEQA